MPLEIALTRDAAKELARLPLDPRVGRMILAARDNACLMEVMIIAAALSVQDPRDRPLEAQGAADLAHKKFADEKSEFASYLKIWKWFEDAIEHKKTNRQLQDNCRANFLSQMRLREWRDVHSQLLTIVREILHAYRTEKEARGLLDFGDLIVATRRLLKRTDAGWVLHKLDRGIDHILVDEAQDTSPEQWDILEAIAHEFTDGAGQRNVHRTFFAVGDEKQSIYSFQGADVAAFCSIAAYAIGAHRVTGATAGTLARLSHCCPHF